MGLQKCHGHAKLSRSRKIVMVMHPIHNSVESAKFISPARQGHDLGDHIPSCRLHF